MGSFIYNMKKIILLLIVLLLCKGGFCQDTLQSCKKFTTGVFHYYPKNSLDYVTIVRTNNDEYYIDNKTKDTSHWEISWINDCTYKLKYDFNNKGDTKKTRDFLKKHTYVQHISSIGDEYYIFDAYFDKVALKPIITDTFWFSEKIKPTNHFLFEEVTNNPTILNTPLSDTCKYALLYIYRPGHVTLSLSNLPVYLNYSKVCSARNNTGYVFKVLSPGPVEIITKQYNDTANTTINVKFGNAYYVKTSMNWTITSKLNNYRLKVENIDAITGKNEFDKVKLNSKTKE